MRNIARRLLQLVLVVVLSTLFAFSLLRLFPGDVADAVLPSARSSRSSSSARTTGSTSRSSSSTPPGSATWCRATSARTTSRTPPVIDKLDAALPVSLQLMLYAQILALLVAIPLGVLTAYRANTKTDRSINAGAFALLALPSFVLALALAYFVGVKWQPDIPFLGQIPVTGYEPGWLEAAVRPAQRRPR